MRLLAIIKRVLQELIRDKRTLALMFLAPLLVLTLMYFIFNGSDDDKLNIGYTDSVSSQIINQLPKDQVNLKELNNNHSIRSNIENHDLDAYVDENDSNLNITYTNEDPSKSSAVKQLFGQAIQKDKMDNVKKILKQLPQSSSQSNLSNQSNLSIANYYLYGDSDSNYFDKMFPILIGFFVFLFVFLISGIALLRERTTGTLERLFATSVKRSEIVFGYLVGYGVIAIIQTIIIVLFSVYLLDVELAGSIWYVFLINIMLAITALAMGIFISTFANSEFQMIQFIPIVAIPQVFFSGIFPLENMPNWLSNIGYLFPLRYAGNALTNIMIKGQGWNDIWFDILIVAIFIIVFITLNIVGLKRYRKV